MLARQLRLIIIVQDLLGKNNNKEIQNKIQICFYEVVVGCLHAPRIFVRSTHVFNLPIARNLRYTFRIGTYVSSTCSTLFYMDAKELF